MPINTNYNFTEFHESGKYISHFNFKALFKKMGGNETYIHDILDLGKKDLIESLSKIKRFYNENHKIELEVAVHRLRGTASAIGFTDLYNILTELENNINNNINLENYILNVENEITFLFTKLYK